MAAQSRHSIKERAVSEARQFFAVFLYIWLLLAVFGLYRWVILADANIVQHQGFAILKALAFAKIMFIAEKMGFGERFKEKPLIWPMLLKSALFAILLMIFSLIEKAMEDWLWPHAGGDQVSFTSPQAILSVGVVMFVALIPFFGIRELGKVLGAPGLYRLMFVRRTQFVPLADGTPSIVSKARSRARK